MGYYFGKDIESALFPKRDRFGAEQDTPTGSTLLGSDTSTATTTDTNCPAECQAKGIPPGTPEWTQCIKECSGTAYKPPGESTGDTGKIQPWETDEYEQGGISPNCLSVCKEKARAYFEQTGDAGKAAIDFNQCRMGCPDSKGRCSNPDHYPDPKTGQCVPYTGGECRPGFHPDPQTGECVPDTPNESCAGGYRLADKPIQGSGGNVWTDEIIKPEHGWVRDPLKEGHDIWNNTYGLQKIGDVHKFIQTGLDLTPNLEASACGKGFKKTIINGEEMCCPSGRDDYGEETPGLGEFQFPAGMQEFYDMLMGRGKELLNKPLGITPEEEAAMFGKNFENITNRGDALREQDRSALSRVGGLGTGMELEGQRKISRGIEEEISDAMRDLLIYGSERKKSDLLDFTGASQGLFGSGLQYENLMEAINSSRRGEGQQALMNMLTLLFSGAFN